MGCEEVNVGPDVTMRNGDRRLGNGELVRGTSFGPLNSPSADDTGSGGTVQSECKASTIARW